MPKVATAEPPTDCATPPPGAEMSRKSRLLAVFTAPYVNSQTAVSRITGKITMRSVRDQVIMLAIQEELSQEINADNTARALACTRGKERGARFCGLLRIAETGTGNRIAHTDVRGFSNVAMDRADRIAAAARAASVCEC
ncbi:hypothetical protein RB195_009805 [Necator americanus]|uniref:Uncharacterized protein n=1 Tax=Necator americanus TaxID=51031 RepID=A0ABR1CVJ4_NECAM